MTQRISDQMIEYLSILTKLSLSKEERTEAKKDMEKMLDYMDKLNELDIEGVEPESCIFQMENVFREDVEKPFCGGRDAVLSNAPEKRNGSFVVPKTVE